MNLKASSGRENRQFKRITTDRPIKLINKNESFNLKMINLSQEGAGLLSAICFEENEPVELEMKLPFMDEMTQLKLKSKVVHTTPVRGQFLLGLHFETMSKHQQFVLEKFINHKYHSKL